VYNEALGEEIEEKEVDVLSLLADEGEEDQDEHADDDEQIEGEDIEAYKLRLGKRNHSLKKSKQANKRIQEENDLLKKRLDEMESRISGTQPNVEAEKLAKEEHEWMDRVVEDHTQALAYTDWKQGILEDKVANYLGSKLNEFEARISQLNSAVDPEKVKYKEQIELLRRKEGFSSLDDETLLKIAKGFDGAKVAPRGGIGGQRPRETSGKEFKLTAEEREAMGF